MLNEQAAQCPAENVKRCSHLLAPVTEEKQMEHVYVANGQVKDKKDDSKASHRRPAGGSLLFIGGNRQRFHDTILPQHYSHLTSSWPYC